MSKIVTLRSDASAIIAEADGYQSYNDHTSPEAPLSDARELKILARFPPMDGEDRYREILGANVQVYCRADVSLASGYLSIRALPEPFDPDTVTRANYFPYDSGDFNYPIHGIEEPSYRLTALNFPWEIKRAMTAGVSISSLKDSYDQTYAETAYSENPPLLELHLGDVQGVEVSSQLPAAGSSLNIKKSCDFSFSASTPTTALDSITLTGAALQWREKGSETIASRTLAGEELEAKKLTMPADSFTTGDIEYRFALTSNSGVVNYGPWTALVTPEAVVSTVLPRPGSSINRAELKLFECILRAVPEGNFLLVRGQPGGFLRWRLAGSGDEQTVNLDQFDYTGTFLPANTLPSGSIEYQFTVVDELGRTVESPWYTVSTVDTVSTARIVAPNGSVEDGERPITLRWEHINESGALATKSEIQAARQGEELIGLATVEGSATEYSAPDRTFVSGEWQWRVRTYNLDGVAGAWSAPADFVTITSPSAPIVTLDTAGPRPVIRWQTSEQEGYELELDGVSLGTYFGTEQCWRSPEYLGDGSHSLRVRVQNVYGLWSDWGVLLFLVSNTPGPAITLQGGGSREARLVWDGTGYDFYVVYRDGIAVAKLGESEWIDYYAIDAARYQIRGCYRDRDDYGLSNEIALELLPDTILVAAVSDLGTGGWLALPLSQSQYRASKTSLERQVNLLQLAGSAYPVAEPEAHYSKNISVSCAFRRREDCRRLEALAGRLVCLKTPCGEMAIGYLQNLSKNGQEFFSTYSFAVQHLETEEAIDLDA